MLGEKGHTLIKEAVRTPNYLGPFNEDCLRQCIMENRELFDVNREEVSNLIGSVATPAITFRHTVIERNKRCMLAYLKDRVDKLRKMRWEFGAVLPDDITLNMCEPEKTFFSEYNKLLAKYMKSVSTDITMDLQPPKALFIEVRVKKDYGEIETPEGEVIQLTAGTLHNLPRDMCEQLILQGVLEHVPS